MPKIIETIKVKFQDPVFVYQYTHVVKYLVNFLISVIFVKSTFPSVDLAYYEIMIFMAASLTTFWIGGFKNAMFSWFGGMKEREQKSFPTQVFWVVVGLSLILSLCLLCFPSYVFDFFGVKYQSHLVHYLAIFIVISVPNILIDPILYLRNHTAKLLIYTHWSQLITLILTIFVAVFCPVLSYFIWLLLFLNFCKFVYLMAFVLGFDNLQIDKTQIRMFVIFSFPLIANMFLGSSMDIIDGWFVTHYFDPSYFPVFRYGAKELPLSAMLFSALSIALVPEIMKHGKETQMIRQRATKLLHWLYPLTVILMVLSPFLFPIIYDNSYKDSAIIFNIYLLILTSRVLLPQSFCMALHQHSVIVWSGVLEIITNVLLSYWWMQIWGVYGLAMATVVAYFVQKIILIIYNYYKNQISIDRYIDLKYYSIYMISLIMIFFITINFMK